MPGQRSLNVVCAAGAALIVMGAIVPIDTHAGWPKKAPSNVAKLADCIDKLECHIDQYGSVVAKQPDVWGQARLTKYRRMVETQLEGMRDDFKETINATISRSDQATFANSLAIQAAISGPQAIKTKRGGSTVVNNTVPPTGATPASVSTTSASTTTTTSGADDPIIDIPGAAGPTGLLDDSLKFTTTTASSQSLANFKGGGNGIALEPTVMLDQMTNYLNHLNQLRRTNEGDDTADAPGYSLHLVRIPVSVLPGKKTQQGYGAEITVTAEPVVNETLLPKIFRSLITNDVVDLVSGTMLDVTIKPLKDHATLEAEAAAAANTQAAAKAAADDASREYNEKQKKSAGAPAMLESANQQKLQADKALQRATSVQKTIQSMSMYEGMRRRFSHGLNSTNGTGAGLPGQSATPQLPATSAAEVFSYDMVLALQALTGDASFATGGDQRSKAHLILDLRKIAARYVDAAYTLLAAPGNEHLWSYANQALLNCIRNRNQNGTINGDPTSVESIRAQFVSALINLSGCSLQEVEDPVVALAWAIVYYSTVLNEQLLNDMVDVAEDKGALDCHPGENQWQFFLPDAPAEARRLFANYVRARWPIHVFAIDPMTEDQNVADTFSRRREMQLALSLAFTSGSISAQNFTRYARRLELDMETIALNRTQVGFSHGNDTFGWRFYPRVQSPPIDSNAKVFFRDLLVGGPNRAQELNTMRLEPGARECVALVVMPSFVPYVRFDTRTNWFRLSNPKQKEFDLRQTVELGTMVTCLRESSAACQQQPGARGTDLALLLRSVDQLEHRLPLQTCLSQVPFELTESGQNLFNHGVSDLAPRLRGYYGEPGAKEKEICVTVIGENFSLSETRVIAGNALLTNDVELEKSQVVMLSRQVLVLKIPATAIPEGGKIDLHVATPYGVSNHLDISIPTAKPPSSWGIAAKSVTVTYGIDCKAINRSGIQAGYYVPLAYTPAIIAKFSGDMAQMPNELDVSFEFDNLGTIVVRARKLPSGRGYTIDVVGLTQALLDNLIQDHRINPNTPPESSTYSLSPISIKVSGESFDIDGALQITFKPLPPGTNPPDCRARPKHRKHKQVEPCPSEELPLGDPQPVGQRGQDVAPEQEILPPALGLEVPSPEKPNEASPAETEQTNQ